MQKIFGLGAAGSTKPAISANATSTMRDMLLDGLHRITKVLPRSAKDLRQECAVVIQRIQEHADEKDSVADLYFYPFKLACESSSSRVRSVALDCIQLLISFGFLYGEALADPQLYPALAPALTGEASSGQSGSAGGLGLFQQRPKKIPLSPLLDCGAEEPGESTVRVRCDAEKRAPLPTS